MEADLSSFLARHAAVVTESVAWGNLFRFHVASYLCDEVPPPGFVTSVRGIVLVNGLVLVQRDQDSLHILPGGRREAGEPPEATLHREIREETGWTVDAVSMIGFMHYHHLDPKPPNHPYPYPDFLQIVYAARGTTCCPEAKLDDGYEIETRLLPAPNLQGLGISQRELLYLNAALTTNQQFSDTP